MSLATRSLGRLLLAIAAMGPSLGAQDLGLDAAFKVRAGYGLTSSSDHLDRRLLGLGLEVGYGWSFGRTSLEVGYQYKSGRHYLTPLATMAVAPGTTVDPTQSVDSRKNQLGGIAVRFSFERKVGEGPWYLRAGAQVGGVKFRQEYIGDVTNGTSYEDTYNGIVTRSGTAPSPFAGLGYTVDPEQRVELNLLALGYTSADYRHVAGTVQNASGGHTSLDVVATRKRTLPHLELCYALRF